MVEGQKPGESDRDYARRLQQAQRVAKQAERDAAIQRRLEAEAAEEEQFRLQDEKWEREMRSLLGDDPAAIQAALEKVDPALAKKAKAIKDAHNQGKNRKAAKLARKDKSKFKDAQKRGKKKK